MDDARAKREERRLSLAYWRRRTIDPEPAEIGPRIREERRVTQTQFCMLLNSSLDAKMHELARWSESTLSRLERGKRDAIRVTDLEVELIAHLLGMHPRRLLGLDDKERIVNWKMLSEAGCGRDLALYVKQAIHGGGSETLCWGEHLGALATNEVTRRFHDALYGGELSALAAECRDLATRNYDDFSVVLRAELAGSASATVGRLVHMVFESDLVAMAYGDGRYASLPTHARHCLSTLPAALLDPTRRVQLLVVRDDVELRRQLRFADSLACVGGRLALWREPLGGVCTTTATDIVSVKRQLLERLRGRALHASASAAADYVRRLVAVSRETQLDFGSLLAGPRHPIGTGQRPL